MKNILFFPINAEEQFLKVSRELESRDPSLKSHFLLLVETEVKDYEDYKTFDMFVDECKDLSEEKKVAFESKHNLNFNDLIHKGKHFIDQEQEGDLYFKFLSSLEKYIVENSIDTIVCSCISDGITYGTFKLSQSLKVPFLYPMVARVAENLYLADSLDSGPVKINKTSLSAEEVDRVLDNTLLKRIQPSYANFGYLMFKKGISLKHFKTLYKLVLLKYQRKSKYLEISDGLIKAVQSCFRRKTSNRELLEVIKYKKIGDFESKKFIYWPLHFHPEAGTIILGRWFHNQYELLKNISRVLPVDVELLVKEHRGSVGRRPLGFYREISKLPGVSFVHQDIDTFEMIEKSKGVAVITGTAGLEALALNQNVMTFGDVHYNKISSVIKAIDLSKLRTNVLELINGNGHLKSEVLSFFSEVLDDTVIVDNFEGPNTSKQCIEGITDLLLSYKENNC